MSRAEPMSHETNLSKDIAISFDLSY